MPEDDIAERGLIDAVDQQPCRLAVRVNVPVDGFVVGGADNQMHTRKIGGPVFPRRDLQIVFLSKRLSLPGDFRSNNLDHRACAAQQADLPCGYTPAADDKATFTGQVGKKREVVHRALTEL